MNYSDKRKLAVRQSWNVVFTCKWHQKSSCLFIFEILLFSVSVCLLLLDVVFISFFRSCCFFLICRLYLLLQFALFLLQLQKFLIIILTFMNIYSAILLQDVCFYCNLLCCTDEGYQVALIRKWSDEQKNELGRGGHIGKNLNAGGSEKCSRNNIPLRSLCQCQIQYFPSEEQDYQIMNRDTRSLYAIYFKQVIKRLLKQSATCQLLGQLFSRFWFWI